MQPGGLRGPHWLRRVIDVSSPRDRLHIDARTRPSALGIRPCRMAWILRMTVKGVDLERSPVSGRTSFYLGNGPTHGWNAVNFGRRTAWYNRDGDARRVVVPHRGVPDGARLRPDRAKRPRSITMRASGTRRWTARVQTRPEAGVSTIGSARRSRAALGGMEPRLSAESFVNGRGWLHAQRESEALPSRS